MYKQRVIIAFFVVTFFFFFCLLASLIFFSFFFLSFSIQAKVVMFVLLLLGMITCATIADVTMTDGLVDCLWSLCLDRCENLAASPATVELRGLSFIRFFSRLWPLFGAVGHSMFFSPLTVAMAVPKRPLCAPLKMDGGRNVVKLV